MDVSVIKAKGEPVRDVSSFAQCKVENDVPSGNVNSFYADKNIITKDKNPSNDPFIKINTKASFKEISYVSNRQEPNAPTHINDENRFSLLNCKILLNSLPKTDSGLDDESDQYAFSAYPKTNKKYQLGNVKGKLESFKDITGVEKGTFRILYGNTTGDKKFNFDGAAIGLELEARQNSYKVNQRPEIVLPVDNNSNYFFEQRNLDVDHNHGNINAVFALEGVKIGVKYEKNKGFDISTLEFHDGALTTNIVDFSKKYPYIAAPIAAVVAGGLVTGGYFLSKSTGPININLGNVIVYRKDSDLNKVSVGISPSFSLDGSEKFVNAFKIPGAAATVLYKYDDNLTLNVNGGYNSVDGPHAFGGAAMKF